MDILLDLLHPAAFRTSGRMSERAGSQDSGIIGNGEFIQYIQEFEELYETLLLVSYVVYRRINLHYGFEGEGKTMSGPSEHTLYRSELILGKKLVSEYVPGKLYGDLPYILGFAGSLLPDMLKIFSTYQNQFIITDFLHAIPYYSPDSLSPFYEVQLELPVTMERICEFRLVALYNVEAVLF